MQRKRLTLGHVATGLAPGCWPKDCREVVLQSPHTQHSVLVPDAPRSGSEPPQRLGRPMFLQIHGEKGWFVRLEDHSLDLGVGGMRGPRIGARVLANSRTGLSCAVKGLSASCILGRSSLLRSKCQESACSEEETLFGNAMCCRSQMASFGGIVMSL